MELKDSDNIDKFNSKPEKKYSPWNKKKKVKFGSKIFKVPEEIPFSWFVIGFLIFSIKLHNFSHLPCININHNKMASGNIAPFTRSFAIKLNLKNQSKSTI